MPFLPAALHLDLATRHLLLAVPLLVRGARRLKKRTIDQKDLQIRDHAAGVTDQRLSEKVKEYVREGARTEAG